MMSAPESDAAAVTAAPAESGAAAVTAVPAESDAAAVTAVPAKSDAAAVIAALAESDAVPAESNCGCHQERVPCPTCLNPEPGPRPTGGPRPQPGRHALLIYPVEADCRLEEESDWEYH